MAQKFYLIFMTSLLFKDVLSLSITIQPTKLIAEVGESITVLCRAAEPLEACTFDIQSEPSLNLNPTKAAYHGIKYYGEGLDKGFCGINMIVQNQHNGVITCAVSTFGDAVTTKANMTLTVARKPNAPEMSISKPSKGTGYMEDEQITATCLVRNGRPAADITWYIGDSKITDGLSTPTEQVTSVEALYTIEQSLTRKLKASDNGKALKCLAGHTLLTDRDNSIIRQLIVYFAPKPSPESLEHFGLVEGEEGRISVTVTANPRPTLTWTIGELRIHEGDSDKSGRFRVSRAMENQLKGPGTWEAVLIINPLMKEDVEMEYILTAENAYGEQMYKVAISTNPEPRVELGAGTIAGIVVTVLIILLLISVLVFARAKGRWCFSGGVSSGDELADPEKVQPNDNGNGGNVNPAIQHNNSTEYITDHDPDLKKPKEDTPV